MSRQPSSSTNADVSSRYGVQNTVVSCWSKTNVPTCRLPRRPCRLSFLSATWGGGTYSIPRFRGRPEGIASPRRCGTGTGCAACRSLRSWSIIPCRGQSLLGLHRLFRAVSLGELGEANRLCQGICGGGWLTCKDVKAMECVLTYPDKRERLFTLSGYLQSPLLRWIGD